MSFSEDESQDDINEQGQVAPKKEETLEDKVGKLEDASQKEFQSLDKSEVSEEVNQLPAPETPNMEEAAEDGLTLALGCESITETEHQLGETFADFARAIPQNLPAIKQNMSKLTGGPAATPPDESDLQQTLAKTPKDQVADAAGVPIINKDI